MSSRKFGGRLFTLSSEAAFQWKEALHYHYGGSNKSVIHLLVGTLAPDAADSTYQCGAVGCTERWLLTPQSGTNAARRHLKTAHHQAWLEAEQFASQSSAQPLSKYFSGARFSFRRRGCSQVRACAQ